MDAPRDGSPPAIRAHLLGQTRIALGDEIIPADAWPRRTSRLLLLVLLATPGHRLPRDQVLEHLWPDATPESALNAFYIAVHGLRRVLEPKLRSGRGSSYLEVAGASVALRPERVAWVDVDAFEAEIAAAGETRRERLAAALGLYSGDLLADEPYVDWPVARREHLRSVWREAVLAHAEVEREAGRPLLGVPALERVLQSDPTDEAAYRALMRAYAASGRGEDAIRQFERGAAALRDELGIEPGDETRALAEEIRAAPIARPEPVSPQTRIDNLPAPPNPLVGRGRDVEEVLDLLLAPEIRLVTITGPGGVGKTRLSLETASLAAGEFADGVCFVSLAAIRDPRLVAQGIAQALALEASGDRSPLEALTAALRERELLLLLDNVEQVLEAAPELAELLAACPRLTLLVTSREPLHLRSEHEYALSPLPVPDPDRILTAGGLTRYPAVELFVQRASAVNRAFALNDDNAAAVGTLCARLDGLPLAIELAAARARHLEPRELVAGLADRFALLADGYRDLPPRQRTMRAAIAWSHDLLTPEEQARFRRLAVFSGGFSVEAGERVSGSGSGDENALPASPLPPLPAPLTPLPAVLAEKGLLRVEEGPDGPRYAMLETIREFGLDALRGSGERAAVERAHAEWFLRLAEQAAPELTGPDQVAWHERLDAEQANLRLALEHWLHAADGAPAVQRMAAALWRYWWSRGLAREGRSWLEQALAAPDASATDERARALYAAGELSEALGDSVQAEQWYEQALELERAIGDDAGIARVLNGLGITARTRGYLDRAETLHEQALTLLRGTDDRRSVASTLNNLGAVAYFRGNAERADACWQEAAAAVKAIGDQRSSMAILGNLGALALMRGDPRRAAALHEEALGLARRLGDVEGMTRGLVNLAGAQYESGEYAAAGANFHEALEQSRQAGNSGVESITLYNLGKLAERQGNAPEAAARFAECLAIFWAAHNLPGTAAALERLGALAGGDGRAEVAVRLYAAAAAIRDATGAARDPVDHGEYEREVAACRAALGDEAFDRAWAAGAALSPADAVAEALAPAGTSSDPVRAAPGGPAERFV